MYKYSCTHTAIHTIIHNVDENLDNLATASIAYAIQISDLKKIDIKVKFNTQLLSFH